MIHSSTYFIITATAFFIVLIIVSLYSVSRIRRASQSSWESLVKRLVSVDTKAIEVIALDLIGKPEQREAETGYADLDTSRILEMIGGLQGLEILKKNSGVLVDMAAHLEHWYPEALAIAEELRLEARELDWHVDRLRGAAKTGNLEVSFPAYGQQAIATYYRMTRELLAFCAQVNPPIHAALVKAL
jgi:hypothetical protein